MQVCILEDSKAIGLDRAGAPWALKTQETNQEELPSKTKPSSEAKLLDVESKLSRTGTVGTVGRKEGPYISWEKNNSDI